MSDSSLGEPTKVVACPYSAGADILQAIRYAKTLLEQGELETCASLLMNMEEKYTQGVELFALLGEVLMRRGNTAAGMHYKTLHEILRGTYKIAREEQEEYEVTPPASGTTGRVSDFTPSTPSTETIPSKPAETAASGPGRLFPVTASMGREFVRQGHYDCALEIFDLLIKDNPGDQSLLEERNKVHKLSREKHLLGILRGWLGNVEKLKAELSTQQ